MAQDWFYKLFINECKAALSSKQGGSFVGQTPSIGDDGHLYIGEADTGILTAEGVKF